MFRANRAHVRLSVGVLRDGRRETAYVEDIGKGGLKLSGLIAPKPGETLRVHIKGNMLDAEIRWVEAGMCGLRFCAAPETAEVRRFLAVLPRLTGKKDRFAPTMREMGAPATRPGV
ncbi:MAG: PilZ domain-containing protein [Rhodobacteraceae bacterium]|nr:MAG: PilZ domain-containing protein [Paracoccaceae bacterium]